jgi:hypothetical protein
VTIDRSKGKRTGASLPFVRRHSLGIATVAIFSLWLVLYCFSDPQTHWGAFFGNAVADWSGSVVLILATKYLYEIRSKDSRPIRREPGIWNLAREHSLLIFILVSGLFWLVLFARSEPDSKWGQVFGNVLSEWVQMGGVIYLTTRLIERGSAESRRS